MKAAIRAIEYHLPERVVTTEDLASEFPDWPVAKIGEKIGVRERHIAGPEECSSDLAVAAGKKLFDSGACDPSAIDFVILCTQSPDYFLPTSACLVQDRLGIPTTAGAFDFNLACSGYVYGLGMAQGLIETGQASNVLLLTAETYSKFMHPRDKSVRAVFGDAAAATLLSAVDHEETMIGPYVYGTDGSGARNLIVPTGGLRKPRTQESAEEKEDDNGNVRAEDNLFMDGAEIFNFTITEVPRCASRLLEKAAKTVDQIDLFIFHQANQYMLEQLRKRMKLPADRFYIAMSHCGNTVSSTIPIALKHAACEGRIHEGQTVMLAGWGVGYSWGATLIRWFPAASV